ncbi:pyridoxal phosphate-dependent aminotransferase [Halosquirtibacter xylanolyticus]|uniref:pyridoxal phosphate-dependent aminotransferase n=1 Tax=Halosquirtibacter xylanolyticus TaxID=3374599 RepID=UPI00374928BE|nr:pyridoxal phosphate-dependent aminotransferase [Prolixibacteraceae bacterium]
MPEISIRGKQLPESSIRKLVPFADAAKDKGVHVFHLNIGQPDIKTPAHAIERIKNFDFELIPYGNSAGNLSYRTKLAKYYQSHNLDVDSNNILVTTGGSEAISFAFKACFNPGDEIIIPEPFYANYLSFAQESDIVIKTITSTIEDGFKLPSIDKFKEIITEKTKGIFICNPSNPTGYLYNKEELQALAQIVKEYDLYLLSDEVYNEFVYDGRKHCSVLSLKDIKENVIMIDSVSKHFSACGVRIGSLVSHNKRVISTILKFAMARLCPPMLGQEVAEAAFDSPPEYIQEVYKEYLKRRDYCIDRLNKMEGVYSPMPQGAFYSIVKLPIDHCDKFCQWLLESFSYRKQTIMLAPATGFYKTEGAGIDQVRIAYVLKTEDLEKALDCLEEALKVYPGRTNK